MKTRKERVTEARDGKIEKLEKKKRFLELLLDLKDHAGAAMVVDNLAERVNAINATMCWDRVMETPPKGSRPASYRRLTELERAEMNGERTTAMGIIELFPQAEDTLKRIDQRLVTYAYKDPAGESGS